MRLKDEATRRMGEILFFELEKIEEKPGFNLRDMQSESTRAYIREMADSIKASGTATVPPITIWQEDGHIYVDEGHCRRRAHIIARDEGAPITGIRAYAVPESLAKSEAERTLNMFTSNNSLPLTPMEKGKGIQRLLSFQWSIKDIATRQGVTPQAISNMLAVLELPAPAAELVEKGAVSPTLAVETVRKQGAILGTDALKTGVEKAKEQGKTHATKKHLPPPSIQTRTDRISPIAKPEVKIDWNEYGPQLKEALEKVLRLHSSAGVQRIEVVNARALIKEINQLI